MGNMFSNGVFRMPPVAVIIPCFESADKIEAVVQSVPGFVHLIICVDDCSTDQTGQILAGLSKLDPRLCVVMHKSRQGMGAATATGYRRAIEAGAEILVKIDSDGRMNPDFIETLIQPILDGDADYTKGNRFFDLEAMRAMPAKRMIGNAASSVMTKFATGYWNLFDPTCGFSAIHADVAGVLPLKKLQKGDLFEEDLLFRLSTIRARVIELPVMVENSRKATDPGDLKTRLEFCGLSASNFGKRILYNHFLRGFSVASLSLMAGLPLCLFGTLFGIGAWMESAITGVPATTGAIMVSAVSLFIGFQLLWSFLQSDMGATPSIPIHRATATLRAMDETAVELKELRESQKHQSLIDEASFMSKLEKTFH